MSVVGRAPSTEKGVTSDLSTCTWATLWVQAPLSADRWASGSLWDPHRALGENPWAPESRFRDAAGQQGSVAAVTPFTTSLGSPTAVRGMNNFVSFLQQNVKGLFELFPLKSSLLSGKQ